MWNIPWYDSDPVSGILGIPWYDNDPVPGILGIPWYDSDLCRISWAYHGMIVILCRVSWASVDVEHRYFLCGDNLMPGFGTILSGELILMLCSE